MKQVFSNRETNYIKPRNGSFQSMKWIMSMYETKRLSAFFELRTKSEELRTGAKRQASKLAVKN
ncbi:hypothetical protein M2138_001944 [Dysgonomonadaceae bacterium PH5-43]|nr:hypothetical protein [Dysgonomonadaceae bacterium PH5-43]